MKKITPFLYAIVFCIQFTSAQTIFEPEKISLKGQHDDYITFDPKGNYLLFTRLEAGYRKGTIYWCEKKNNTWQQPTVAFFSGKYEDSRPYVSPDGKRIFFASNRPTEANPNKSDLDIWYIEKNGDKWTEPINAGANINTSQNETHPSVAGNGNLYFVKWGGGVPNDIYWSRYEKGIYQTPQPISSINTEKSESHVFISPDESFLFFGKPIDQQGMDGQVFISINKNGEWSQPMSFDEVNSNLYDYSAKLSIDKKRIYFSRTDFKLGGEESDIYFKEVEWSTIVKKYLKEANYSSLNKQFPQNNWLNMDTTILSGKFGEIHSIMIWKDGKMEFEKYYNGWKEDSVHQLQSATKSIIATLMGLALQQGFIKSVDDKISTYLPNVPEDKKNITIKDLLTQRHGLKWIEGAWEDPNNSWRKVIETPGDWFGRILGMPMDTLPGTKFLYSNAAPTLVAYIVQSASGMPIDSFTKKYLFTPLGIKKCWFWPGNGKPAKSGMPLISLTSRDMLKIGQLYLQNGKWKGQQLLPEKFVLEATSSQVKKVGENGVFFHYDYGYFWWSNPLYRLSESNKPSEIFMARGAGGQNIIADKKKKIVVVITAWNMARSNWPQAIYHDFIEGKIE